MLLRVRMLYYIKHEVIGSVVQQIDEGVSTRYVQHQSIFFEWDSHLFTSFTCRDFVFEIEAMRLCVARRIVIRSIA